MRDEAGGFLSFCFFFSAAVICSCCFEDAASGCKVLALLLPLPLPPSLQLLLLAWWTVAVVMVFEEWCPRAGCLLAAAGSDLG